jgi:4-hydroxybenzoate polyprenyltransferase
VNQQQSIVSQPVVFTGTSSFAGLIECMRPVQWIKNGFVLAPLIFSRYLTDISMDLRALAAFAAFCLAASGVYLLNDSFDWRADRNHPDKRRRPIPSGRLSPQMAAASGLILAFAAIAGAFLINGLTGWVVLSYALLNGLYSLHLKHVAIVDMLCISTGFVLRVEGGGAAIHVTCSHWLLMCTFLLALFLAIAKRRQEVTTPSLDESGTHRSVLASYKLVWLDQSATLVGGAALVSYALYAVSAETVARFGTDRLIYTLPFVVFGILRYLHLVHGSDRAGNPTSALIADKQLLLCVGGWVAACAIVIYL